LTHVVNIVIINHAFTHLKGLQQLTDCENEMHILGSCEHDRNDNHSDLYFIRQTLPTELLLTTPKTTYAKTNSALASTDKASSM
jgi:hypothetical protein